MVQPSETVPFTRQDVISYMQKFKYSPDNSTPAYIIINKKVYDVKEFIPHHPGGSVILTHVGRDGSDVFDAFHPEETTGVLADYYVGDLVENDSSLEKENGFGRRVRALKHQFQSAGLFEPSALYYITLAGINVALVASSITLVLYFPDQPFIVALAGCILGLFWQQCGWYSHDFLHHQVFKNRFYNDVVGYIAGGVAQGFSVTWWKDKHNTHHAQPNIHQEDPDIDTMPLLAWSENALELFSDVSDESLAKFFVSYQAILYFPILSIARMSWALQSILFVTPLWQKLGKAPISALEQASVAAHWAWYLTILTVYLSPPMALLYFLVSQMSCGLFLASVFSLNHNGMPIFDHETATDMDFYIKQIVTGRDVKSSLVVDWFMGGLNFQIEHHLFPSMPRHSLAKIKPIIKNVCKEHEIAYHTTGFWEGTGEVLNRLEEISKISKKIRKSS